MATEGFGDYVYIRDSKNSENTAYVFSLFFVICYVYFTIAIVCRVLFTFCRDFPLLLVYG